MGRRHRRAPLGSELVVVLGPEGSKPGSTEKSMAALRSTGKPFTTCGHDSIQAAGLFGQALEKGALKIPPSGYPVCYLLGDLIGPEKPGKKHLLAIIVQPNPGVTILELAERIPAPVLQS